METVTDESKSVPSSSQQLGRKETCKRKSTPDDMFTMITESSDDEKGKHFAMSIDIMAINLHSADNLGQGNNLFLHFLLCNGSYKKICYLLGLFTAQIIFVVLKDTIINSLIASKVG